MSEKNDGKPPRDPDSGAEQADGATASGEAPQSGETAESTAAPPTEPPPGETREGGEAAPPKGFAGALALVLVIVLLVLGAGAAYWFQERLRSLEAAQADAVPRSALEQQAAALEERIAGIDGRVSNLNETVDARLQGLAELRARVGSLDEARTALADRVDQLFRRMESSRSDWRHAEAAYLASIADYRARLLGDVDGALEALEAADELLAGLGGEGVDARRGLAAAIDQLLAADRPERDAVSEGITAIAQQLAELPLGADIDRFATEPDAGDADAAAPAGDGGWRDRLTRAWNELREGFSELVTVSRDRKVEPLPTPEARFLLEQNLTLQLEAARLAAFRGNSETYRGALARVDEWVAAYFDTSAEPVQGVRERLARLRETPVTAEVPDIREALAPVRNWE